MCDDADIYARAERFARAAIGKPWTDGAAGPNGFDCWGLARSLQREVFGRDLPIVDTDRDNLRAVIRTIAAHPVRGDWTIVPRGGHGDVVTMAHHKHPSHIGVFLALDRGGVLHAVRGEGVRFDTLPMLKAMGWSRILFHRHAGERA